MTVRILLGDMRERLLELDDASIDSVVTDPPYHLTSIVKRFGSKTAAPAKAGKTGAYARAARGFMGQMWDGGDIAFQPDTWREVFRVMKPGAHLLAFSGTRTYHRMVCAIEDAGFEIRDQIAWLYGSGFPKSHDVSKAIDKAAGHWRGRAGKVVVESQRSKGREYERTDKGDPVTAAAAAWSGWGTALKPALEPIVVARKPLDGTVAANVLAHGTGALNIGACRVESGPDINDRSAKAGSSVSGYSGGWSERAGRPYSSSEGRWPANVVHDGSGEVVGAFPASNRGIGARIGEGRPYDGLNGGAAFKKKIVKYHDYGDGRGSAARFFYSAKADQAERHTGCEHLAKSNCHPTVKPVDLMRWLCRLVTPPGGTVLDPFAGSGSTLIAADAEQFNAIGIEMDAGYAEIARARIAHAAGLFAEVMVA